MRVFSSFTLIYIVLTSYTNSLTLKTTDEKSCKATTDKGKLDLSPLAKTDGQSAAFNAVYKVDGPQPIQLTVYWNPCADYSLQQATGKCDHTEVCLDVGDQSYTSFGSKDMAVFKVVGDHLQIDYGSSGESGEITVDLICGHSGDNFKVSSYSDDGLGLQLTSSHACIGGSGLSAGSILCIILVVLLAVYLIAGVIVQKFVRKAEGSDIIPQKSFWFNLTRLVKEGFMYLIKGCKPESSYEEM